MITCEECFTSASILRSHCEIQLLLTGVISNLFFMIDRVNCHENSKNRRIWDSDHTNSGLHICPRTLSNSFSTGSAPTNQAQYSTNPVRWYGVFVSLFSLIFKAARCTARARLITGHRVPGSGPYFRLILYINCINTIIKLWNYKINSKNNKFNTELKQITTNEWHYYWNSSLPARTVCISGLPTPDLT